MIDTDKYEGHTPAPWTVDVHKVGQDTSAVVIESAMTTHSNDVLAEVEVENDYALIDAQLIADAPLLLAEVHRLRDELFNTHASYSNMEQMLAFAVGIKQGLLTDMSMDDLLDAVNRDHHDRLNKHMDGKLND